MTQGKAKKRIWCLESLNRRKSSSRCGHQDADTKPSATIGPRSFSLGLGLTPGGLILRAWAWSTARLQPAVLEEQGGGAQRLLFWSG